MQLGCAGEEKEMADQSPFTVEQRLVTAVWLHERPYTRNTMETVKVKFHEDFGMEPPRKAIMLGQEKHASTMGSVRDHS